MRKQSPSISIIMPSLNQGQFIENAIQSVFSQNIHNVELIVMDGGSTDETLYVLENQMQEHHDSMRWYSESDRGASHAVNKALSLARAPIIGWLNSDDLYHPESLKKVLAYFESEPEIVMLYGKGQHIDIAGQIIADYKVAHPESGIDNFSNGSFICQPAAFFRRSVLEDIGYLDETLNASFDFDLWLRIFKHYPGRIGYIDEYLASLRLHADCKTQSLRRDVAKEGMAVLHRHLGHAPAHWFKTYIEELFAIHPHKHQIKNIAGHCLEFLNDVKHYMQEEEVTELRRFMDADCRFQLMLPQAGLNIYPDGWLPPVAFLRLRNSGENWKAVRLRCEHANPLDKPVQIKVTMPWGDLKTIKVRKTGQFDIKVRTPNNYSAPVNWSIMITTKGCFNPSVVAESTDTRELAFKVTGMELLEH